MTMFLTLMGLPRIRTQTQSTTPSNLYPQALQLKLYQAFIFSIPILFTIILFLLFYLFYLKRRATATNLSSSTPQPHPSILPTRLRQSPQQPCQLSFKKEVLPTVLFDEELRTKDTQCSVCLGEFELKEELLQVPSCKHLFHIECLHHWLHSNATCPLCRCSVTIFPTSPNPKSHIYN